MKILKINPVYINYDFIRQAARVLRRGSLVVFPTDGKKVGIIASKETAAHYHEADYVAVLSIRRNLKAVAHKLFRALRRFDDEHMDIIIAETFPERGIGKAIMNRLHKAATN